MQARRMHYLRRRHACHYSDTRMRLRASILTTGIIDPGYNDRL